MRSLLISLARGGFSSQRHACTHATVVALKTAYICFEIIVVESDEWPLCTLSRENTEFMWRITKDEHQHTKVEDEPVE